MKTLFLSFLFVAGLTFAGNAQTKAVQTAKISTPGVGCEECKKRIETYLNRHDGVSYINVNYRRKETNVKYWTDRTDIEQIKTAIANIGYDADDVSVSEDAYKRLPKTCKRTEDGGLPKH